MSCRRWEDLLPEILSLILLNLHGKDVPVFRAFCRNWNSVPPPKSKNIHHVSEMLKYPFLLSYRDKSSLILYTPAYNKTYSIGALFSELEDAQIHSSNYGWLLLSRRERSRRFFFLQPVTGDIINLPRLNGGYLRRKYPVVEFVVEFCGFVVHNGAFYCLGQNKRLGVFDPRSEMWRFLDMKFSSSDVESSTEKAYMMESSRGELISVVVGLRGEFVRMYIFDEDLRLWRGLSSLGDQVAFLSPTSSIVLSCKELQFKGLENTIHFPRFDGDFNVFYSLSTGRFHSFKGGYTSDHPSDKELQLNSTWMMPEF
ncbi:F-box/kelch-repeat protein At1g57790 [Linum perenne]